MTASPVLKLAGAIGFIECDWDRSGGGVAVAVDVHEGFSGGRPSFSMAESMMRLIDLVRDDQLDLIGSQFAGAHRFVDQFLEFGDGEFVDFAPFDLHELLAIGDQLLAEGKPASRHAFHSVRAGAVGVEGAVDQAAARIAGTLEDHRAGSVAEEDATGAVGVIGDAAEGFGADDQDIFDTGPL